MLADLPTGTVTFLFTDLEGSTRLWEAHPEAMKGVLARHDALLRDAVESHNGIVVKTTGDGLHAVFESAPDGVAAAVATQRALVEAPWEETGPPRVRMALHTGEGQLRDGDYYGSALNRAARLIDVAHGGQTLLSQATEALIRDSLPPEMGLENLGEHALRDLIRPEHVFQLTYPWSSGPFPPLKSLSHYPNNLPLQLSSFVGREHEIGKVKQLLAENRLLTLTGPGGTGKTRLMLQVAADVLHEFSDGVWLVELAALTDPNLVVEWVAKALGVQDQSDRSLGDSLENYLRLKRLMLLIDNCEHLLLACANLAQRLLQACPRLKVLATSREGLALPGEITFQVPSLSLPVPSNFTLISAPNIPQPEGAAELE